MKAPDVGADAWPLSAEFDSSSEEDAANLAPTKTQIRLKTEEIIGVHRSIVAKLRKKALFNVAQQKQCREEPARYLCCSVTYTDLAAAKRHCAKEHPVLVLDELRGLIAQHKADSPVAGPITGEAASDPARYPAEWSIPRYSKADAGEGESVVLLYYAYVWLDDPAAVCAWIQRLCECLDLTGKIRLASEGVNGTVAGTQAATALYIDAMLDHPVFGRVMRKADFKSSVSDIPHGQLFDGLRVKVHEEIVPMGIDPGLVRAEQGGRHASPREFHALVEEHLRGKGDTVLVDCRNFYESEVGRFRGAVAPSLRKFKYWPEYVDKNEELFKDKKVIMYCTGGIRCERGSAYLVTKGIAKDVIQLEGGIHKYMEEYPDGHFRGKLYVFDNRQTMASNGDIVGTCRFCSAPFDEYSKCRSAHCRLVILSCHRCRQESGSRHHCCVTCYEAHERWNCGDDYQPKERCECVDSHVRIPQDC